MAFSEASKFGALALVLLCSSAVCFNSGRAYDEESEAGGGQEGAGAFGGGGGAGAGALGGGGGSGSFGGGGSGALGGGGGGGGIGAVGFEDPPEIFAKALSCLDDKHTYSGCEETCRLTASGYLNIPAAYAEEFCRGPCLKETHLVLNCMENVVHNFRFYNRATIRDVRDTMAAGCGYGSERGNFNVLEHIEEEESKGGRDERPLLVATLLMTMVPIFFV